MHLSETQVSAGLQFIKNWLSQEGYEANSWDGQSQDGNWVLYCMTEADGANCVCCQEPILQNAPVSLQEHCGWKSLHLEALAYVIEKAAETP